jgi:8-oxo-dGTP diphosphatase
VPRPREHRALKWVAVRDLANFEMPPADRPLLPVLRDLL